MAREINEIQDSILEQIEASGDLATLEVLTDNEQANLAELTSTSKVAIWRLFVWVVAFVIWVSDKLWDVLRDDLEKRIAETRPFTKTWYTATSLNYQHGYDLPETGVYPTPTTAAEQQLVNASKVIKKAAVVQTIISGVGALRIKVATLNNGELVAVGAAELAGFQEYMELMGAAGVYVVATTAQADDLKLVYDIHYNPLILDNEGQRLDGTNDTPCQTAIKTYLKGVEFNGVLSLDRLDRILQNVEGVEDVFIQSAASKYASFDYDTTGVTGVGEITKYLQPDSGYLKLDEVESVFNFIAYDV